MLEFVVDFDLYIRAADQRAAEARVKELLELLLREPDVVEVTAERPEEV